MWNKSVRCTFAFETKPMQESGKYNCTVILITVIKYLFKNSFKFFKERDNFCKLCIQKYVVSEN